MLQPVSSEALSAETHVWCRVLETDMSSVQKDEEDDDLLFRIDTNAPFYLNNQLQPAVKLLVSCYLNFVIGHMI